MRARAVELPSIAARSAPGRLMLLVVVALVVAVVPTGLAASPKAVGSVASGRVAAVDAERAQGFGTAPETRTGFRTYHLGNSLTNTLAYSFPGVLSSAGRRYDFLRTTKSGQTIDWLWNHPGQGQGEPDYRKVFAEHAPIDHLVIQPYASANHTLEFEADYARRFERLARESSPDVKLWLYASWPSVGFSDHWAQAKVPALAGRAPARTWAEGVDNHMAFYEALRSRLDGQNGDTTVGIIPVGLALVQLERAIEAGEVPGTTEFRPTHFHDGIHVNARGAYMVALVHYSCLYGADPRGLSAVNSGLSSEQTAVYQDIVWDVVRDFRWCNSPGE